MGKGKEGESSGSGSGRTPEPQGGIRGSVVSSLLTPLGFTRTSAIDADLYLLPGRLDGEGKGW